MRETKERDNEKENNFEHRSAHMQSNLFHDKEYTFDCRRSGEANVRSRVLRVQRKQTTAVRACL
jgi:hypothetical protein